MSPEDNSLESGYEASSYSSSLENRPASMTPPTNSYLPPRRGLAWFKLNRLATILVISAAIMAVLIGGGILAYNHFHQTPKDATYNSEESSGTYKDGSTIAVQQASPSQLLQVGQVSELAVNGQLTVNKSLVLTPSNAPATPTAGEVYYNQSTNQPYYYNGSQFISLTPNAPQSVTALGGDAGVISLGSGLTVSGNTLSVSSTILQPVASLSTSVVKSLQGLTGNVSFSAGNGISLSGTSITNSGVVSLGSSNNTIDITNNGHGSYDLTLGGGGAVVIGPSTAQTDSSSNPSLYINKTGTADLIDLQSSGVDTFVVDQSGQITSGSIDYSQVQGRPASVVTDLSGATGSITIGSGLDLSDNNLSNSGVVSITGTTNQVIASAASGSLTLSLPQDISTGSSPTFSGETLSGQLNANGGTSTDSLVVTGGTTLEGAATAQNTLAIQGGLTVGVPDSQTGDLYLANSASSNTVDLVGLNPSGSGIATIQLPSVAANTTDTVCLKNLGNCGASSNTVTASSSGTDGTIAMFSGSDTIANSSITDNGSIVTVGELLSASTISASTIESSNSLTISPGGKLTVGASNQTLSLVGSSGTTLAEEANSYTDSLVFTAPSSASHTITIPDSTGTICLESSTSCGFATSGSGVTSVDSSVGALSINDTTGSGTVITIQNASTTQAGIAEFNSTDFQTSDGLVDTIQGISTTADVQFDSLALDNSGTCTAGGNLCLGNNGTVYAGNYSNPSSVNDLIIDGGTNNIQFDNEGGANSFLFPTYGGTGQTICTSGITCASGGGQAVILGPSGVQDVSTDLNALYIDKTGGTGDLVELQTGSSKDALVIDGSGNATFSNTTTAATFDVSGTLQADTITPDSDLTVGSTSQSFTLQGDQSSEILGQTSSNSTYIGFGTPSDNSATSGSIYYAFDNSAATNTQGSPYFICTTAGNCSGAGGSVTALSGGTADAIPLFSGSLSAGGNLEDSILSESDSNTINVAGSLNVGVASTTDGNLVINNAANSHSITISEATAPSSDLTINLPTSSGTIAVSATGPLELDSTTGVLSCPYCDTSGGSGGSSAVQSLNSLSGNININNSTTSGQDIQLDYAAADGSTLGIATFNSTNFQDNGSGLINTIQDITTSSSPTFANLTLQGTSGLTLGSSSNDAQAVLLDGTSDGYSNTLSQTTLTANQTIAVPDNSGTLAVAASGNLSLSAIGNLTISSSPSFTTSVTTPLLESSTTLNITPGGALTVGSTSQAFTLQGTGSSVISASSSDYTTSLSFDTPTTANAIYIPDEGGTICLSSNNCSYATSGDYIYNQTTQQTGANIDIQGSSGTVAASIQGAASQDILNLYASSSSTSPVAYFDNAGDLYVTTNDINGATIDGTDINNATISGGTLSGSSLTSTALTFSGSTGTISAGSLIAQTTTNTTTAFQVQTSSGSDVLDVDTTNSRVGIDVTYSSMSSPTGLSATAGTSGTGSLTAGTTYYYEVTAVDSLGGETTPSSEVSATAPTTYQNINLSWTAVNGAIGYHIYRSTTSGSFSSVGYYSTLGTVSGSKLTFTDIGGTENNTTSTPPTTNTAYTSTNLSNNNGQVSIGGNGTPEGQLYVSGSVPTSAIGSVATGSYPASVYVQGSYAYVANESSSTLTIYNISNPSSPTAVGSVATGTAPYSVYVQGSYAYVTNYSSNTLTIYNISNPSSPTQVGSVATGTAPRSVYVQGSYAYVANESSDTLTIYNISNPSSPTQVGSVATGSDPLSVYVQGSYAYVANDGSDTLTIYNISNPSSPTQVGSVATGSYPLSVYVQGSYAYVANESSHTLTIYNISNPSSPTQVGSVGTGSYPYSVYVQGSYAYVTNFGSSTLTIYNISNPSSPTQVGSVATGNDPTSVYVQGSYAYVANDGSRTLTIYNLGGEYTSSLQAGSIETSSLQVDSNASVSGDQSITGGLTVGGTAEISGNTGIGGSLTLAGALQGGNDLYVSSGITITPEGTTGTTTYTYEVSAVSSTGGIGLPSPPGTTTTGNATLSSTNYNKIAWTAVSGASSYNIYRTVSTGTPSSTGLIGNTSSTSFNDTGLTASGSVPTTDNSGSLTINGTATFTAGTIVETTTNTTTAFQVQTSSGSDVLDVDTTNSRVGIDVTYRSMSSPTGLSATAGTSGTGSLTAGTTYYYEVTAIDSLGGETTPSSEVSATAPTTYQNINLSWTAVNGAIGYHIYRSTTSGSFSSVGYYSTLGTVSGSKLTFTDIGGTENNTTSTPPTTNTAYTSTNLSNNNGQVSIGGNGTPEGQLYVSGSVPTSAIGSVATGSYPASVYVQGSYAYVANESSDTLTIYNISNPSSPTQVGSVATGNDPDSVYVQGSYAYVANESSDTLTIYNISNPSSPTQVGSVATGSYPLSVYVQGSYAYVANYSSGTLTIYNISNPSSPTQVGSVGTGSYPASVYVQGSYAYVASEISSTLTIYNISNPSSPTQVGKITTTGSDPDSVYVQGSYAYVASEISSTLTIYNISNPSSPTQVGSVATGSEPLSVYVQGSYAYVANDGSDTLTIYNISNPSSPTQVGSVATGSYPHSVYVQGSYAYVTNFGSSTLTIYNLGGEYTSSLQAGSIETSSLQVDSNASVSGDQSITGGLTVGGTAEISGNTGIGGSLTLQGALQAGNNLYVSSGITITPEGTTGTTTYTYEVSAVSSTGGIGLPSPPGTTTTGNATLSSTNYNKIAWTAVSGASSYNIYRTVSTGTPSSTGLIGNTSSTSFNDTGLTASGSVPTIDTSGSLTINGAATINGNETIESVTNNTTAFQVQNASGVNLLQVDTSGNNIYLGGNSNSTVDLGAVGSAAYTSAINIGTSTGAAQTISLGSTNSGSSIALAAGNGIAVTGLITQSASSGSSTGTISLLGQSATNANTSSSSTTVNADSITLTGTANSNSGQNVLNGINFNNVTAATNNSFNGLHFGTGYTSLLQYGSTQLISGTGQVQSAAISGNYDNLSGTGELTSGSIGSGFGAIDDGANEIQTTGTIQGGNGYFTTVGVGTTSPNNALSVVGNIAASGTITGGVDSPDYAEYITATDPNTISAGDLVSMDPNNPGQAVLSNGDYDPDLLGVISTHPGFITNAEESSVSGGASDPSQKPLALAGRVPVNVDGEDGPIAVGDYLTASSVPGYAMKATAAGPVVGVAMSAFNGSSSSDTGQVTVYIERTYYNPESATGLQGDNPTVDSLTVNGGLNTGTINVSGQASVGSLTVVASASIGANLTVGDNLTVTGSTSVNDLIINGHIITSGSAPNVSILAAAGSGNVTVSGDDSAGTITISTGANPSSGNLANLLFSTTYSKTPHILLTPDNSQSAPLDVYPDAQSSTGFDVGVVGTPTANATYTYEYLVVQ